MKQVLFAVAMIGGMASAMAQFTLGTEIRPRAEYDDARGEEKTFVSQRTRLNAGYTKGNLSTFLSLQNVRNWGDVKQLNVSDVNGTAIHQAWAELKFAEHYAVKFGRQELVYDDSRILGNVGWAQQGRSHDVAVFKYTRGTTKFHLGAAHNEYKAGTKTYKNMQYAWLHTDLADNFTGSFLFLNNGMEGAKEKLYSQTAGTHLKYGVDNFTFVGNAYYQFGKDKSDKDLSAYLVGLEANYKASADLGLNLGFELQSGNGKDTKADENNAFTPLYGTNHKFNGWMDYFYVGGRHMNGAGLLDVHAKVNYKTGAKTNLVLAVHNFSKSADVDNKQLGTEIDMAYHYKLQKDVKISLGYSQMFASDNFSQVKSDETNNWAWLMVTINPTLFTSK